MTFLLTLPSEAVQSQTASTLNRTGPCGRRRDGPSHHQLDATYKSGASISSPPPRFRGNPSTGYQAAQAGHLFGGQEYARRSLRRGDRDIRWPEGVYGPYKVQHGKNRLWQRQDAVQIGERWRPRNHRVPGACLPLLRRPTGCRASLGSCRGFRPYRTTRRMHVMMSSVLSGYQDCIEQRETVPVDCDVPRRAARPVQVRCGEREDEERTECDERRTKQRPQPGAPRRNVRRPDTTEQPGPGCPIRPVSIRKRGGHTATCCPGRQWEALCLAAGIQTIAPAISLSQCSKHRRPRRHVPTRIAGMASSPE